MQRRTVLLLCLSLTVTGCARLAGSRLNPLNWFGRSTEARLANPADRNPLIPAGKQRVTGETRPLIAQIESLQVDRTPGGAIVTATGIAETQAYFDAQLVRAGIDDGVLTYDFRAQRPAGLATTGSLSSRRITAADTLTSAELADIRSIQVRGATNARSSSR